MRSRFASPGDAYLSRLGELVYAITSLEGTLIFDIPRLSAVLPASFSVSTLTDATTAGIGQRLIDIAPTATDDEVRTYLEVGGNALRTAAKLRNHILHARPATHPTQDQRLYRYITGTQFWIDDQYLDAAIDQVGRLNSQVNASRPSFGAWPAN